MPQSYNIQFTIRQKLCGPVVYVRETIPANSFGVFKWGPWKKAKDNLLNVAICKLKEVDME